MRLTFPRPLAKILIIKPSSLGDIIHSLPFLHAVSTAWPRAEIHWVVAHGLHVLLANHPLITKLWIINKDNWKKPAHLGTTVKELAALGRGLRREKFDLSLDLSGLLRSGLITWAAGARYRLGFTDSDEGSPFFYTHKIEGGREIHAIDRYLKLAAVIGGRTDDIQYPLPPFDQEPAALRGLPAHYAVMAPAAGKEANRWPAERFGELAARLPVPTLVISSPADRALVEKVVAASRGKAVSMAGRTTLPELVTLISRARFFISNDTGPMHIAAATRVPVFAIFGPANPVRTGPYGDRHTVIQERVSCGPCYAWKPCDSWLCMEKLTVGKVLAVIMERIKQDKLLQLPTHSNSQ